jgi:hypothetical protein
LTPAELPFGGRNRSVWKGGARRAYLYGVAVQDTVPPALRASDADREQAIELLRHGSVEGRISHQTFLHRMDAAMRAQGVEELAGLVRDLPPASQEPEVAGRLDRWTQWWSQRAARLQWAWRRPRLENLTLPRGDRVFVIGRAPECDLTLLNMTVSWRHAELRHSADGWVLSDLGSRNGTHVNGWQAGAGFTVQAGDHVRFGTAEFRIYE